MAQRPDAGAGDGDRPDYDWLYGKGRQQPPPDQPDPTVMLPQQRRPEPAAPGGPPVPPGPAGPRRGRLRRPRFWVRLILMLLVLWLVYLIAVPIWTWTRIEQVPWEPDGERPPDQPGTTYLMVGSDSRANLSPEERKEYSTGNAQSTLADTIMVLHTGSGPSVLLSFPRDWTIDGRKINGYYNPGDPTALVAVLESQTGMRIDDYVEVGLAGVPGVVDAVGGIEICPDERIKDPKAGLNVKKGCQEADGQVALGYARTRATTRGDLDRVGRQREVVAAIGDQVLSPWTVINPVRWWRLNSAVPEFFVFGEGTGPFDVLEWALAMSRIGGNDSRTCTMPVTDGSATTMDTTRAEPLFDAIIEDRSDDITRKQCTAAGVPE
jgi:LCP family protein required for cell wall assembly